MKRNAVLLGFSFLISKILGLARDALLAANFGAGGAESAIFNLDTYYAAFRLPDLLFNLLSYGVLSAAFVPLFVEILKKENRQNAFKFTSEILNSLGLVIIFISAVLFVFAPQLLRLFVPGFAAGEFSTTVQLTRLMLVTPFLFTISSIAGGVGNSLSRFMGLALAPIMYNLGIIGGIVFLSGDYGVYGVAIGVVIGAFLNALSQFPSILKQGFRYQWTGRLWTPRIKEMITLSFPRIIGMSVSQLALVVDTIIASTLVAGSITVINFAANLESLPLGLIGISVAVVSFGTLSSHAAENDMRAFISEIFNNVRKILFLLIPLACGMFILRLDIVRILLVRGEFGLKEAVLTANTMGIFLLGLIFGGLVFLLARGFYALKNTKTPVIIGIIAVTVNIISSILLTKVWEFGTYGLAFSNALSNMFNMVLLVVLLGRKLNTSLIDWREIFKFVSSALLMIVVLILVKGGLASVFGEIDNYVELILRTLFSVVAGVIVYFGSCLVLRSKEGLF